MTKKYLYEDFNGELFKVCSKQKHIVFLQNIKTNKQCSLNELAFDIIFKQTDREVKN
jgi:hypothetical protein